MPTDDLLTELRRAAGLGPLDRGSLLHEAADRIEALTAERDRCAEIGTAMVRREAPGGDCPAWLYRLWEALERADAAADHARALAAGDLAAQFAAAMRAAAGRTDPDSDPDDGTEGSE